MKFELPDGSYAIITVDVAVPQFYFVDIITVEGAVDYDLSRSFTSIESAQGYIALLRI